MPRNVVKFILHVLIFKRRYITFSSRLRFQLSRLSLFRLGIHLLRGHLAVHSFAVHLVFGNSDEYHGGVRGRYNSLFIKRSGMK